MIFKSITWLTALFLFFFRRVLEGLNSLLLIQESERKFINIIILVRNDKVIK